MQPSPYDRTMAVLRIRFRRRPVASAGVLLAAIWVAITVYETASSWGGSSTGWFFRVSDAISLCSIGVVTLAGLVWLIERTFGDGPR
jgi:hypothetical protein